MNNAEFAKYTADLNAASSRAYRKLRAAHLAEYYRYLLAEMNRMGYQPNKESPGTGPRWRKVEDGE